MHLGHSLVRSVSKMCLVYIFGKKRKRKKKKKKTSCVEEKIEVRRRDRGDVNKGYENVISHFPILSR